ncbi:PRR1 [Auxenochlorella protothecoides x Auxenochlorella symbiontica]
MEGQLASRGKDVSDIEVLVIDRNPSRRQSTVDLVGSCGYQVITAESGNDALELLTVRARGGTEGQPGKGLPSIILKNHGQPYGNAPKFLNRLRAALLQAIPVIVLGSGDDAAILQCLSLGAVDFWVYPLRQNEVAGLWTRVWWRKTAPQGTLPLGNHVGPGPGGPAIDSSGDSSESEPARSKTSSPLAASLGAEAPARARAPGSSTSAAPGAAGREEGGGAGPGPRTTPDPAPPGSCEGSKQGLCAAAAGGLKASSSAPGRLPRPDSSDGSVATESMAGSGGEGQLAEVAQTLTTLRDSGGSSLGTGEALGRAAGGLAAPQGKPRALEPRGGGGAGPQAAAPPSGAGSGGATAGPAAPAPASLAPGDHASFAAGAPGWTPGAHVGLGSRGAELARGSQLGSALVSQQPSYGSGMAYGPPPHAGMAYSWPGVGYPPPPPPPMYGWGPMPGAPGPGGMMPGPPCFPPDAAGGEGEAARGLAAQQQALYMQYGMAWQQAAAGLAWQARGGAWAARGAAPGAAASAPQLAHPGGPGSGSGATAGSSGASTVLLGGSGAYASGSSDATRLGPGPGLGVATFDRPDGTPSVLSTGSVLQRQRREARAAALRRYRDKREGLSFRKTIRYAARKVLADSRPRVKGQFVRSSAAPTAAASHEGEATLTTASAPGGGEVAAQSAAAQPA